jgi:hypothetical protein
MRKFAGLALIAVLAMAAVTGGAEAAVAPPGAVAKPPPSGMSNGNGEPTCVVACLTIVNPNNPRPGTDCIRRGSGGATLTTLRSVRHPCPPAPSVVACGRKLGNLRRVTVRQVGRIDAADQVRLVPICDTVHRSLTEIEMSYLARGNVQGLIRPISRNATLAAALDDGGYRADDVLGIVLDPHMVTLYVSRAGR